MRRRRLTVIVAFAAVIVSARGPLEAESYQRGADYFPNLPVVTQDGKALKFYDDVIKGKIVLISFELSRHLLTHDGADNAGRGQVG